MKKLTVENANTGALIKNAPPYCFSACMKLCGGLRDVYMAERADLLTW